MAEEAEAKAKISEAGRAIYEAIVAGQLPPLQGAEQLARIYLALGSTSGSGGGDASDATLQAILSKLPDYSATNTTTGSRVTTAGTIAAGAKQLYLEVLSGPVTVGGLSFPTDKVLNLENPGPGGLGAIAYDATGGEIEIWETR